MRVNVSGLIVGETNFYHAPLSFQCVYGYSDERDKNVDGEFKSDILGEAIGACY